MMDEEERKKRGLSVGNVKRKRKPGKARKAEYPVSFGTSRRKWLFSNFCNLLYEHNETRNIDGLQYQLYPYQESAGWRAVKSVMYRKGWEIFWAFARQMGKTEVGALSSIFLMTTPALFREVHTPAWFLKSRGVHGAVFAPTTELTKWMFDRVKDQLRYGFLQERFGLDVDLQAQIIRIRGAMSGGAGDEFTSTLIRRSASKEAKQEGATLSFAFLDEAQDIADVRVTKSIYPMFTTTGGSKILMGSFTPEHRYYFINRVAELQRMPKDDEEQLYRNLKIFPWSFRARHDPVYKRMVEAEIDLHGLDSPIIQTQYLLQLHVLTGSTKFVRKTRRLTDLRWGDIEPYSVEPVSVGIDAGQMSDSTVVTVTRYRGRRVLNWQELIGDDYPTQEIAIRKFLFNYPNIVVVSGESQPPTGTLLQYLSKKPNEDGLADLRGKVQMMHMSTESKSMLYNLVLHHLTAGGFSYPNTDCPNRHRFEKQYLDLEKSYTTRGLLRVAHPKGRDKHDDYPDSHAFSLLGIEGAPVSVLRDIREEKRRERLIKEGREAVSVDDDDGGGGWFGGFDPTRDFINPPTFFQSRRGI